MWKRFIVIHRAALHRSSYTWKKRKSIRKWCGWIRNEPETEETNPHTPIVFFPIFQFTYRKIFVEQCFATNVIRYTSGRVNFVILHAIGVSWIQKFKREWNPFCHFFMFRNLWTDFKESSYQSHFYYGMLITQLWLCSSFT